LTSSLNPSKLNQPVTLTAAVSPSTLAGVVTFYDGTNAIGANLLVNGQATLILNSLSSGTHALTASYPGDLQHLANASQVLTQTVSGALPTPTINLSSSLNPSRYGQAITFTAAVSPSSATGTVAFYDGQTLLETVPLVNGRATLTTNLLLSGPHSMKAYYGGDLSFAPTTSAPLPLTVTTVKSFGFSSPLALDSGLQKPMSIAVADFNNDGKADFVVTNYIANSSVSVFLGIGDGTFQKPIVFAAGAYAGYLTVGDFNGDGKPDIVLGNNLMFLGNGDGTFRQGPSTFTGGIAGDFNNDGKIDLGAGIALGNGDGTFQARLPLPNNGANLYSPDAAGDLDGDGRLDLVMLGGNGGVAVLLGNGDGTFRPPVNYGTTNFNAITVADFNGDGKPDIAATCGTCLTVTIFLNNGDGTFRNGVAYPAGTLFPNAVIAADFDGDGRMDLAVPNFYGGTVILLGKGDGSFQAPVSYDSGIWPYAAAVADFNGDGRPDLAVPDFNNSNVNILLATTGEQLRWVTQPVNTMLGVSLPPLVLQIQDSTGRPIAGRSVPVTITSAISPPGSGSGKSITITATTVDGVATFSGVVLPEIGYFTLTASTPGLPSVTSNTFSIVSQSRVAMAIESPSPQANLPTGSFAVTGWALDDSGSSGLTISSLSVSLDGVLVGVANYGLNRPISAPRTRAVLNAPT
jgi:hypothetical protein